MEGKLENYFDKKRACALITVLIMILNMFSPYGTLMHKVRAEEPQAREIQSGEPYYELKLLHPKTNKSEIDAIKQIEEEDENAEEIDPATYLYYFDYMYDAAETIEEDQSRAVVMELRIKGCGTVNASALNLKYDTSILTPTYANIKRSSQTLKDAVEFDDFATLFWGNGGESFTPGQITINGGISAAQKESGIDYIDEGGVLATFKFRLADGVKIQDLTKDIFSVVETPAIETGLIIPYKPEGKPTKYVTGQEYLKFEGFGGLAEKSIAEIIVNQGLGKDKYYVGEDIDFTEVNITIKYDDGSEEEISDIQQAIEDGIITVKPNEDGKITIDNTKATEDKKVVISAGEVNAELPYKIVTGITINQDPTNTTYEHGDPINIEDGSITITYSDGSTETKEITEAIEQGLITIEPKTADVDNPKATITYKDGTSTADITLTVTDPIVGIKVTKDPTKIEYNSGETIEFAGGTIEATTKSGKKISNISMTEADVTKPITMADINSCSGDKWQNGDKEAGKQIITITYEGQSTTFNITVNDTIASIAVKTQPTAKNKYGTEGSKLDLTGATLELTTAAGHKIGTPVVINIGMLDLTNYDSSDVTNMQNLPVTYAGMTTTEGKGVNIKLKDYITGITVTAPNDFTSNYNEELNLSNVTYVKNYASGATSQAKPVTIDMITEGFNKTPSADEFTNQKCQQTVTVKLSTPDDADIDIIPVEDTFNVTIKDKITGIAIAQNPNNVIYNYGDPFNAQGGRISFSYASGATSSTTESMTNSTVSITEINGSPINMSPAASEFQDGKVNKPLKVTYTDENGNKFTAPTQLTITIKDILDSIVIKDQPQKEFNHGERFETGSGTLKLTYKSGAERTVSLEDAKITETATNASVNMSPAASEYTKENGNKVTKNVTATYTEGNITKTIDYNITITNDIKSIKVNSTTHQTEYNVNEDLNVDNLTIEVERAVGKETIPVEKEWVKGFDSKTEHKPLTLTITYEENGIEKPTTYDVTVKDTVTSISINNPPTTAQYGEDLNLKGVTIDIVKGSGPDNIPVTKEMIKNYKPEQLGEQTVTVEYGGQSQTFKVIVKDYVKEITLNPESVTKLLNTELADVIKDVKYNVVYAQAGAKISSQALTEVMIKTVYDKTKENQALKIEYMDNDDNSFTKGEKFPATLQVTLIDQVTGVTITGEAKNKIYNHGEELNYDGIKIYAQHASDTLGSQGKLVEITEATITDITDGETGAPNATTNLPANVYDANNMETRTIRVYYEKDGQSAHLDFEITVKNIIDHIEIDENNSPKTIYEKGDPIENAGGKIKIYRKADTQNSTETKDITDDMIKGLDATKVGQNFEATVTYEEQDARGAKITKEAKYKYEVTQTVESITLNPGPNKTTYKYGENINLEGAYLDIVTVNGQERVAVTENMISGFESTPAPEDLPETQTITVTYGKYADGTPATVTFTVTVEDEVTGIVLTPPDKTTYKYGDQLDLTGGTVQIIMASGLEIDPVPLTDPSVKVEGYNPKKLGTQTITVTYEGETKTFPVTVEENAVSIKIVDYPKQNYEYGEELDITGGTIEVTRANGDKEIIPMTKEMITGFNPNQPGKQQLTVTYGGQKDFYDVEVSDDIIGIRIIAPKKLVYNIGERIDLTGGKVVQITGSGKTKAPIDILLSMISGFDTSSEGAKTITVTYKGYKATFSITVVDPLSDIQIVTLPNKLNYKYGENLDVTGGTIQITKESGEKQTINMTPDMITGYNPNKVGQQTLKVTYEGTTKEFIVTVEDYATKLIVKAPDKTEYEYGEELNLAGGRVSIVMASGAIEENVEMTASMLSGYNKAQEGTQTIKVEYKGLQGNFQVKVVDKIKGISMNTLPNKTSYKNGENLDVSGATIVVVKSSGTQIIPVTKEMVSGYNSNKAGKQVITVNYGGFTTEFVVTVAKKTNTKPNTPSTKPSKPSTKPSKPSTKPSTTPSTKPSTKPTDTTPIIKDPIVENPIIDEPIIDEPIIDEPVTPTEPIIDKTPEVDKPIIEKPTQVLGVKDEQDNNNNEMMIIAGAISGLGILLLIILVVVFRRNVKVYVFEDGEFVLGGKDRITKRNATINIDKFLDEDTYPNPVKVILSKSISKKLDKEEIEIIHREQEIKHTVEYDDEEYEITLD